MKPIVSSFLFFCLVAMSGAAAAQEHANSSSIPDGAKQPMRTDGVPLENVIAAVAKKSGKKFIVDPRVNGNVEILGQEISAVTYGDLLSILLLNGYTAIEGGNYVSVIPVNSVRVEPLPLATAKENFPDAQFVTMIIPVKNVSAPSLVPIIRPLLPTYAHLAATPCANMLVMVDDFANVKRLEKLIAALDVGKPYVAHSCEAESAHPQGSSGK